MKNEHIPTEEVIQDIKDTQKEVDDFRDEKAVLMRNPQNNRVKIYMLEGKISQRETFIKQLNVLLSERQTITR